MVVLGLLLNAPAWAQLPSLPSVPGGLPSGLPGGLPSDLDRPVSGVQQQLNPNRLTDLRRWREQELIRRNPREIDVDDFGRAVVRGELVAISPSPGSLQAAQAAGFMITRREAVAGTEVDIVTLAIPPGTNARQALRRLRRADPGGTYDYDHIYGEATSPRPPSVGPPPPATMPGRPPPPGPSAAGVRIGLIDTGVDAGHPCLAGLSIVQRGFAPGGVRPAAHGTATASLLAGRGGGVRSAAPGAALLVADVYGAGPTGGSAVAVAQGLGWLSQSGAQVINVSLVGPPNAAVAAVIQSLAARGVLIVAAVGNDGPAAPPLYPASYPQVIAVTGVDRRDRVLPEASRALHVDFAAPGDALTAARPGGGLSPVRGTSYAAPIVAGRLAVLSRGGGRAAVDALARQARDLGQRGRDSLYGYGVIGEDLRAGG
ncbi:subtilisin family serine protease [Caulobacter ginsengisoli]|uniref:Subtilisin family serine protease n=1 Tax=Caulobacter ginsengisoli TaxID=400775 RepID=A0ABU0IMA6_9CAUL|nr:S8 family serine peptidase [Caulobacter ginsengisoli]MDQ0463143.1 subtilisin family serine protease [Caulobacter ginsengisoli]